MQIPFDFAFGRSLLHLAVVLAALHLPGGRALAQDGAPPPTDAVATAQETDSNEGAYFLKRLYTCDSEGYSVPFAGFNGSQVVYAEGQGITGRDPKTSLVRWRGGELKRVRRFEDLGDRLMLVGEHVQVVEKEWGKRVWDFPLNCFADQCNADILARTEDKLLIGGFGSVYNMLTLISLVDGTEQWPSWLTTCPMKKAAVLSDAVIIACAGGSYLLQKVDLKSRRTEFTSASPDPGFRARELWASETYLFVEGDLSGKRKLYVFSTKDGTLVRKFNVKQGGTGVEVGFLVSPAAGRFVPWQSKGDNLSFWGIDVTTGKVLWQRKFPMGRLVGQHEADAILTASGESDTLLASIDLATGDSRFEHSLPFAKPFAMLLDGNVLATGQGDDRFVVVRSDTGDVRFMGRFDEPLASSPETTYFGASGGKFATLSGNRYTLFELESLAQHAQQLSKLLDSGEEAQALTLYEALAPFRKVVPEARLAFEEMIRYKWLQANLALRRGDNDEAVRLARECRDATRPSGGGFGQWHGALTGFGIRCALQEDAAVNAAFLLELLDLVLEHTRKLVAGRSSTPSPSTLVNLSVVLTGALAGSPQAADAFSRLRKLHQVKELEALFEGHPYWTQFLVEEVEATLGAAFDAQEMEEYSLSADLLHDLSALPMAAELFGQTFEPWLDAQGVYLMPPEFQGEKLPKLVSSLRKRLDQAKKPLLKETRQMVCRSACELALELCGGKCIVQSACEAQANRCRKGCSRGPARWTPPQYSRSTDATDFLQCR